ncbi:tRNA-dihydrouridine(20) synthase [NAD(P)+]-like [Histomonas meleagridis]|uniref:tRNA-dihydrouridine(20) synthase [NAD(P)+]-like n=1 Tax=Histomonas meleagridis TaxID=135588 RepID=UPI00355A5D58|nr:tRNA-dihydrouridine(20) synthase [NAD(P)+]-like [Histomonas meleagridis]KAH0803410.1 tRNA-dihydrouridine(20) synthase [NAD(P)+]-like [Histomonas meleagridis]
MVRASCLPFRLLCLEYGADAVYSPATSIDAILISHIKEDDPRTLYFGWPDSPRVHFHSSPKEDGKLVFQLVGHDPAKAVLATQKIISFSSAVDLNCGCPESFATSRGDGSALMNDPQTVVEVISALRRNFNVPISVKHRIHPNIENSIQFAVACENAGASAIAIHGRLKEQKNKGNIAYDDMKTVFEHIHVAKIGNGGVKSRSGAQKMMELTGCESVIISSAALKNPSVFSEEPKDPITVARRYIEIAEENCIDKREWRWCLNSMLGKHRFITKTQDYQKISNSKDLSEIKQIIFAEKPFSA